MEQLKFFNTQENREESFYILEQTTFGGKDYLLVSDSHPDDENALAYIFHAVGEDGGDLTYEQVEDDETLEALSKIFDELLEDVHLS